MAGGPLVAKRDKRQTYIAIGMKILDKIGLVVPAECCRIDGTNSETIGCRFNGQSHAGIVIARAPFCQALRQRYSMTNDAAASDVCSAWS